MVSGPVENDPTGFKRHVTPLLLMQNKAVCNLDGKQYQAIYRAGVKLSVVHHGRKVSEAETTSEYPVLRASRVVTKSEGLATNSHDLRDPARWRSLTESESDELFALARTVLIQKGAKSAAKWMDSHPDALARARRKFDIYNPRGYKEKTAGITLAPSGEPYLFGQYEVGSKAHLLLIAQEQDGVLTPVYSWFNFHQPDLCPCESMDVVDTFDVDGDGVAEIILDSSESSDGMGDTTHYLILKKAGNLLRVMFITRGF